jgi:heme A synthase
MEALLGAGLVLFGLTADNDSIARANVMMLHLINTFILLAAISLTAWWASVGPPEGFYRRGRAVWLLGLSVVAMMILGASGAITALGDTLYPASTLAEGLRQDFSSEASILLRLRIFHPMIAVATALLAGGTAYWLRQRYAHPRLQALSLLLICVFVLQLVLGVTNVILLAPVWMQIVHLIVSELAWIVLILLSAVTLGTVDLLPGPVQGEI